MNTVYTGADLTPRVLEETPRRALADARMLRSYLTRIAAREWGGQEGDQWAIANNPRSTLVHIYARHRGTGDTITVE